MWKIQKGIPTRHCRRVDSVRAKKNKKKVAELIAKLQERAIFSSKGDLPKHRRQLCKRFIDGGVGVGHKVGKGGNYHSFGDRS